MNSFTLNIPSELAEAYIFYVAVLILKTLLMIPLTGFSRIYYTVPLNPEDGALVGAKVKTHALIERYRRAHLNDLENIPFFIVIAFLYMLTNPSVFWMILLLRIYTVSRIAHSIAYCFLKSASRILIYQIGTYINFYMAIRVILYFM